MVKLVVQVRLLPTPEQAAALEATLRACNRTATQVSQIAFDRKIRSGRDLRRIVYGEVRAAFGLASQPAQHAIKKVADAYTTLRANLRNGNYGPPGSPRRVKIESKPIRFRPRAARPFDDRCLSWDHDRRTVSIWTSGGRLKDLAFTGSPEQVALLRERRRGESDLLSREDMWFLQATIEIPDLPITEPVGFLGVDLGILNIATTSDAVRHTGKKLNAVRHRRHYVHGCCESRRLWPLGQPRLCQRLGLPSRHEVQRRWWISAQVKVGDDSVTPGSGESRASIRGSPGVSCAAGASASAFAGSSAVCCDEFLFLPLGQRDRREDDDGAERLVPADALVEDDHAGDRGEDR